MQSGRRSSCGPRLLAGRARPDRSGEPAWTNSDVPSRRRKKAFPHSVVRQVLAWPIDDDDDVYALPSDRLAKGRDGVRPVGRT